MNSKAIFGYIAVVIITIILFIVAISFTRRDNPGESEPEVRVSDFTGTTSDAVLTARGKIVGNEEHKGYQIIVNSKERVMLTLDTYDNTVISRRSYPNTEAAYIEFVTALDKLGLSDINESDLTGTCATGTVTTYEFNDGVDTIARQWRTSCGSSSKRNFAPDNLFRAQIPDYREIRSSITL